MKKWKQIKKIVGFFLTNQFGYHVTNSLTPGYSSFYPLSQHSRPLYVSFKWNGKSSQSRAVVEVHYRSIHPRVVLLRPPSSVVFTNYPTEVSWFLDISKMLLPRSFFLFFFFFWGTFWKGNLTLSEIGSDEREKLLFSARDCTSAEVMIALFRVFWTLKFFF